MPESRSIRTLPPCGRILPSSGSSGADRFGNPAVHRASHEHRQHSTSTARTLSRYEGVCQGPLRRPHGDGGVDAGRAERRNPARANADRRHHQRHDGERGRVVRRRIGAPGGGQFIVSDGASCRESIHHSRTGQRHRSLFADPLVAGRAGVPRRCNRSRRSSASAALALAGAGAASTARANGASVRLRQPRAADLAAGDVAANRMPPCHDAGRPGALMTLPFFITNATFFSVFTS